jgi:hypothetical protein
MKSSREVPVGPILVIGVVGATLTLVIVFLLEALVAAEGQAETQRKVVDQPYRELLKLEADQSEVLDAYRWVDREKGIVAIPVERAMEIVVREESAKQR